ncbi:MAG: hypothetical protein V9F46_11640 [Chitinophagaceae bacterium]|jgi:hypothetical protein
MERFTLINILSREKTDTTLYFGRINAEKILDLDKMIDFKPGDQFFKILFSFFIKINVS